MNRFLCTRRFSVVALCAAASTCAPTLAQAAPRADLSGAAMQNTWAFEYPTDDSRPGSLLDLRFLNEKVAGEQGFLKRTPDGEGFALANGTPLRIWAANTTAFRMSRGEIEKQAAFLARQGVNMVRLHASISPNAKGAQLTDVNREEIARIQLTVALMKAQGIYTTISPFWSNAGHSGAQASWGLDGYGDGQDIWGLIFFNPRLRQAYKDWMRELLTSPNPHGPVLRDEPAVGLIQVQNEDSLLFWTLSGIKEPQMNLLRDQFGAWLVKKYGSLQATRAAWKNVGFPRDDWASSRPDIDLWRITGAGAQALGEAGAARARDQVQFLAETQRGFYEEVGRFLRDDLGCKQLLNASNWISADAEKLGDIERWTYTPLDVLAVNKYTGAEHQGGTTAAWRIDPGHQFANGSNITNPGALPINLKQVVGHPMLVTESSWVSPSLYQSEGPLLTSAYQALSGVDGFYWFSVDATGYSKEPYFPWETLAGGQKGIMKFALPPAIQSQFPAAALMFRRGYIEPAAVVAHEERSLEGLFNRATPLVTEGKSYVDPNRRTGLEAGVESKSAVDPLAFLVGRVEVKYGGDPKKSRATDLSKYIDAQRGTVKSTTGELMLDHKRGLFTIDAPRAQGASGFLRQAGELKMKDISLRLSNNYASVVAVSLDGAPLGQSRRILVQIGTVSRPTNWASKPAEFEVEEGGQKKKVAGFEIVNTGTMPWRFENAAGTLAVRNPNLRAVSILDLAGYAKSKSALKRVGAAVQVALPADAMYLVLE